jgi:hypothetical protein
MQVPPLIFRRPCTRADRSAVRQETLAPVPGRGPSAPDQRAPPRFLLSVWRSKRASTYFLATLLGTIDIDSSNRPSMAGSRDSSDISPSNIIEPTWETLSTDEQLQFEEHKEQMIQEAKEKFLANFKVDRNNKVVRHRATDPASLRPTPDIPNMSNTNELQSLRNYVDEQREQMQNIIGDMQNDYMRLVRAFDKSSIANFPSHEVELGNNMCNTSAIGCHDQSQPLYGMPMAHTLSNCKSAVNQPICTCPDHPHVSMDRPGLLLMGYPDMHPSHSIRHII